MTAINGTDSRIRIKIKELLQSEAVYTRSAGEKIEKLLKLEIGKRGSSVGEVELDFSDVHAVSRAFAHQVNLIFVSFENISIPIELTNLNDSVRSIFNVFNKKMERVPNDRADLIDGTEVNIGEVRI